MIPFLYSQSFYEYTKDYITEYDKTYPAVSEVTLLSHSYKLYHYSYEFLLFFFGDQHKENVIWSLLLECNLLPYNIDVSAAISFPLVDINNFVVVHLDSYNIIITITIIMIMLVIILMMITMIIK